MNLHEYQTKRILQEFEIPITDFFIFSKLEDLIQEIEKKGWKEGVLKVQVHAGGRGKAGGVKIAHTQGEFLLYGKELLDKKIVNAQTGPEGLVSHEVLVSPLVEIIKEYYLGVVIDRKQGKAIMMGSSEGGMDIEEVVSHSPHRVLTIPLNQDGSIHQFHLIRMAKLMGWTGEKAEQGFKILRGLAKAFRATDATLLEINPLVETSEGKLIALDAKLAIDDNALYRQQAIAEFFDPRQLSYSEAVAHDYELAYVGMEGNIGCMVNGAGLAMATMDIIHHYGGNPANFLDVGGGATQEKVAEGFKLILSDPKVKTILVNIFGGILSCATLASGIVAAAQVLNVTVPLIVRLEGTNVDQGKEILKNSGLNIQIAHSLTEAAKKAVKAAKAKG